MANGNVFLADPVELQREGNKVSDQADSFDRNITNTYAAISDMESRFVDPAIRDFATRMRDLKDDLDKMTKVLIDYSNYCLMASKNVIQNQQNMMDNYKTTPLN